MKLQKSYLVIVVGAVVVIVAAAAVVAQSMYRRHQAERLVKQLVSQIPNYNTGNMYDAVSQVLAQNQDKVNLLGKNKPIINFRPNKADALLIHDDLHYEETWCGALWFLVDHPLFRPHTPLDALFNLMMASGCEW